MRKALYWINCLAITITSAGLTAAAERTAASVQILSQAANHIRAVVRIDSAAFSFDTTPGGFVQPKIDGFANYGMPGEVALPHRVFVFGLPAEATPKLRVIRAEVSILVVEAPFAVLPDTGQIDREALRAQFAAAHSQDFVQLGERGYFRHQFIAAVVITPARLDPATAGRLRLAREIEFELSWETPAFSKNLLPANAGDLLESVYENALTNYQTAQRWRAAAIPSSPKNNQQRATGNESKRSGDPATAGQPATSTARIKIFVTADGIYGVTGKELRDAGLDLVGSDPQQIRLTNHDREIPLIVTGSSDRRFDEDDKVIFRGVVNPGAETILSPYTETNVYWLFSAPGLGARYVAYDAGLYEKNAAKLWRPKTFLQKQRFEQDELFDRLRLQPREQADHWFWSRFNAGATFRTDFTLPGFAGPAATDSVRLTLAFMGSTFPSQYPDHHTQVFVNGSKVTDFFWDGQTEKISPNLGMAPALIRQDANELSLHLPGDTPAGEVDQQYLNWYEITYPALFEAQKNLLEFSLPPPPPARTPEITLGNFTESDIYLVDEHGRQLTNTLKNFDGKYFNVTFQERLAGQAGRYFAFTAVAAKPPLRIALDQPSNWRTPAHGADVLVVAHRNFLPAIQPLVNWRRQQGLRVAVVDVEDIYDELGGGVFSPEAVRDFVAYAFHHWQPPAPAYLLLVGDADYGYQKTAAANWATKTYVPTKFEHTSTWGMSGSDNYFVAVHGNDMIPDLAVGRLPVNYAGEVTNIVEKILSYEQKRLLGNWRTAFISTTDYDAYFESQAGQVEQLLPDDLRIKRIYTRSDSKFTGGKQDFVRLVNSGTLLANIVGHGGPTQIFFTALLTSDDIKLLQNTDKPLVISSWSCLIGNFDTPGQWSLAESMLFLPKKGILAHFGASGLGELVNDFYFNMELYRSIFAGAGSHLRPLGDFVLQAKANLLLNSLAFRNLAINFNLLGDPAMRLGFPQKTLTLSVSSPAITAGDSVVIKGTLPAAAGDLWLEVATLEDSVLISRQLKTTTAALAQTVRMPAKYTGEAVVRVYFAGAGQDAAGAARFTVAQPYVTYLKTEPETLLPQKPFYFVAQLALSKIMRLDSVRVRWSRDQNNWFLSPMNDLGNGKYKTRQPLTAAEGQSIFASVLVAYKENNKSKRFDSPVQIFQVADRPDLAFANALPRFSGAGAGKLQAQVRNQGGQASGNFVGSFYQGAKLLQQKTFNSVAAGQPADIVFDWTPVQPGPQTFTIVLDPDTLLDEKSVYNNRKVFQVNLVTPDQGSQVEFYSADSLAAVRFPPRTLSQVTAVAINLQNAIQQILPSGLQTARLQGGSPRYYSINGLQDTLQFNGTIRARLKYDRSHPDLRAALRQQRAKVFLYGFISRAWIPATASIDTAAGVAHANLPEPGVFSLFVVNDAMPPTIDVAIAGQRVVNGDLVAEQPEISVTLADDSGIDLGSRRPQFFIDGQPLEVPTYRVQPADAEARIVTLSAVPSLTAGAHRLRVEAADRLGNAAATEFQVRVQKNFIVQSLANHPNPFSASTVIAYTLPQPAEEVSLRIYTVAGRLIRELKYFDERGYVEHDWDGADENGVEVANGVYYLHFVARRDNERVERIEKMARLR